MPIICAQWDLVWRDSSAPSCGKHTGVRSSQEEWVVVFCNVIPIECSWSSCGKNRCWWIIKQAGVVFFSLVIPNVCRTFQLNFISNICGETRGNIGISCSACRLLSPGKGWEPTIIVLRLSAGSDIPVWASRRTTSPDYALPWLTVLIPYSRGKNNDGKLNFVFLLFYFLQPSRIIYGMNNNRESRWKPTYSIENQWRCPESDSDRRYLEKWFNYAANAFE